MSIIFNIFMAIGMAVYLLTEDFPYKTDGVIYAGEVFETFLMFSSCVIMDVLLFIRFKSLR